MSTDTKRTPNPLTADTDDTPAAAPNIDNTIEPPTVYSRLRPQHRDFVKAYTNPHTDTYGNGTKSYKAVYKVDDDRVASAAGSRLLSKVTIRNAIEEICHAKHLDNQVTIAALSDIVHNRHRTVSESTTTDKDGTVQSVTRTVTTPKSTDIIKAIDLVNKMTGLYTQQSIDADIAMREYEELRKRHLAG